MDAGSGAEAKRTWAAGLMKEAKQVPSAAWRKTDPGGGLRAEDLVVEELEQLVLRDAGLRHAVALAHGHGAVLLRVVVDRDAQGSPDLVVAAVALADRAGLVVLDEVPLAQRRRSSAPAPAGRPCA